MTSSSSPTDGARRDRKAPRTRAPRPKSQPKAPTTSREAAPARRAAEAAEGEVLLAVVTGAHGITGEVRLKVFADDLAAHRSFNGGTLTLSSFRPNKAGAIARFAEVRDRNEAEALRGQALTVARDALPPLGEGEFYVADLVGLPVVSTSGAEIGRVVGVENYGAGDLVEVETPGGRRLLAPLTPEAVPEIGARLVIEDAYVE